MRSTRPTRSSRLQGGLLAGLSASSPAALLALLPLLGSGCAEVSQLRGRIDAVEKLSEQASRNGALRCAPRELALARAHASFAHLELEEGDPDRAEEHLSLAEASASAAQDLSPPEICAPEAAPPRPPPRPPPPPPPNDDS